MNTLEKLEHLESRITQIEEEMNLVSGKSWEVRHEIYNQLLREIKKTEKQLSRESVINLIAA